jgi:hypothetical protein
MVLLLLLLVVVVVVVLHSILVFGSWDEYKLIFHKIVEISVYVKELVSHIAPC